MANFDSNYWYQIYVNENKNVSFVGTSLYDKGISGAVFVSNTNTTKPVQQWQFFPFNTTTYVIRSKDSGPKGYLEAKVSVNETTQGITVPYMRNASTSDISMFWQIDPWHDGTFYMTNSANGTGWRLNVKGNGLMAMDSNYNPVQDGQRFNFERLTQINDSRYSTVILPDSMSGTTQIISPVPTPTARPNPKKTSTPSSGGLSTGAKAGIGAGVGIIAVLALLGVLFIFMRRRKQRNASNAYPDDSKDTSYEPVIQPPKEIDGREASLMNELHGGSKPLQTNPVELPAPYDHIELPTGKSR